MGQLDNLLKSFDKKINDFEHLTYNELDVVIQQFIGDVKQNLETNDLNASGQLSASIVPLPSITSAGVVKIRIELNDYWKDIDEGTKPKGATKDNIAKMLPQIMNWIANKPSVQQLSKVKKRETLAYLITRAILKKGTIKRFGYKGSKFLSSELPGFKENILKVLEQQLVK
jgi:hypothetical protein